MTELTAEKVRLVLLVIKAQRLAGKIPPGKPVSAEYMAGISRELGVPLDEKTFRNANRRALSRARLAALALQALRSTES